ncbi:putative cyclin-B3-1, partial [Mucuna pruriens]
MVSLTGKSRVGSTRASVGGAQSRPSGRLQEEKEQLQDPHGIQIKWACPKDVSITKRSAVVANKGVILNSTRNPKGGSQKNMDKSSGKYGTSVANTNVRKALADVSNAQENFTTAVGHASSKMKVSAGLSTKIVGVSLRKSFTGRVQRNTSKGDVQLDALNRDDQKNNTNGGQSVIATKDRFTRKPILRLPTATRIFICLSQALQGSLYQYQGGKMLEVFKQQKAKVVFPVRSCDIDKHFANVNELTYAMLIKLNILLISAKATTNRRDSSQLINARSYPWKNRVSDGFVQMVQPNVFHASSRKSTKPIVKTTLRVSTAQRTLKSNSISAQNKLESTTVTSSQDKETVSLSLPDNGLAVSDDANQSHLPSGESNLKTDLAELIPKKNSSRRKSYTTSLIERSKFLKENGEVKEQNNIPNIDNECNQLEVSEYIDEIYHYYWFTEAQNPVLANYMSIQADITPHLRGILINWLIEVHFKYDLMPETLYLTVTLLDQYLSLVTIKKTDMQLVGLTALLLASKYEDFWHPRVKDLISLSAESYTRDQMLEMEKLILRKLKFRLNSPTPYVFMVRFLKAAQSDKKLEHMAFFLVDLCLVEYEALAFKPSLLCASALYVARCTLQITPPWTPLLHRHARYEFHKAAGVGKLKVTYEKYSTQEFGRVAALKPLDKLPL